MIYQLREKYQLSILALLCAVSLLSVFPFTVIRYVEGNVKAAAIDTTLMLGIITALVFAFFTKNIRVATVMTAVFINGGVVAITVANGVGSFLWVYPVLTITFFLIKPIEALCMNVLSVAFIVAMADIFNIISLDSFIVTNLMLSLSAFVYAIHGVRQFRLLEIMNTIDALTGAFNRRALSTDMEAALSNSERNGVQQLLVFMDLDHFKTVNDKYGHAVGDQVLQKLVAITTAHIRKYDRLYRFGGEEFVLLISEIGHQQQHAFIENLQKAIKNDLKAPNGECITMSFGGAAWVPGTTADSWLKRADDALYRAKASGRDCAVFSDE